MVATWVLWLFIVGVATGVVVALVVVVRLPRRDDDVTAAERPTEAAWISAVIERNGGVAPVLLVEEVLDLHGAYLREARPPVPASGDITSGFDAAGYAMPRFAPPGYAPAGLAPPGLAPPGYGPPGHAAPGLGPSDPAPGQPPRMPQSEVVNPPTTPPTRR